MLIIAVGFLRAGSRSTIALVTGRAPEFFGIMRLQQFRFGVAGEGASKLVQALETALSSWRLRSRFRIPSDQSALVAEIHRVGHVLELHYDGDDALIVAHVPPHLEQKLAPYATRE